MVNLNDPKVMEEFCNNIVVAKLIADEVGENPSYEKLVRISDELCIPISEVQGYIRLYKFVSENMML